MFKKIISWLKNDGVIRIGDEVKINKHNTYVGYTGKQGVIKNIYTHSKFGALYEIEIDGLILAFSNEAVDKIY